MTTILTEAPETHTEPDCDGKGTKKVWFIIAVLGIVWGRFLWTLSPEWILDPQYSHGWLIPFLVVVCFVRRWEERPEPAVPGTVTPAILIASALLLCLIPLAFLQAVYPEARPFQWCHALLLSASTLIVFWSLGGRPWGRHFFFCIALLLFCVPWPRGIQETITNSLMIGVATISTQVMLLLGVPVYQNGATMTLMNGAVGVDDACSGIRSLQAGLMLGFYFGEHYSLNLGRRIAILVMAPVIALLLNVARAFFLTWLCVSGGNAAVERYHDATGLGILVGVFFLVLLLSRWFSNREPGRARNPRKRRVVIPRKVILPCMAATAFMLLAGDLAVHAYFSQSGQNAACSWRLDASRVPGIVSHIELREGTRQFLRYESGSHARIDLPDGSSLQSIVLDWKGGEISAAGVRLHTPLVCLPSAGYKLLTQLSPFRGEINGVNVEFNRAIFEIGGEPRYVYHGIWENGQAMPISRELDQSLRSAWKAVQQKRRLAAARAVLLMASGPQSDAEADVYVTKLLNQMLVQ